MSTDILDASPLYRSWVARGKVEVLREAVRAVLEGRFGPLDAQLLALVNGANEETLRALLPRVGSDTIEQILAQLRPNDEES